MLYAYATLLVFSRRSSCVYVPFTQIIAMETDTRKRRVNFTTPELEVLRTEVELRKSMLFGKLSSSMTREKKMRAWEVVAQRVSLCRALAFREPPMRYILINTKYVCTYDDTLEVGGIMFCT